MWAAIQDTFLSYLTAVPGTKMIGFPPLTPYVEKNASSNEYLYNIKRA